MNWYYLGKSAEIPPGKLILPPPRRSQRFRLTGSDCVNGVVGSGVRGGVSDGLSGGGGGRGGVSGGVVSGGGVIGNLSF